MKTRIKQSLCLILILTLWMGSAHATVLKIATLSPDGSSWMKTMRAGAEEIARKTENRVKIKFYPGGVMGDDPAVLRKIQFGQLHGGAFVTGSLSSIYPDIQIYGLPMAFKSFEEVDYVRKRMDQQLMAGMEKNGFIAFGFAEGGFAYLMSDKPVQSTDDFRRQKVWIPDNDAASLETVKAFGVSPIPLSLADVRTGLQTGLIDTVAASAIGAVALQWHTQVKYVLDLPILYISGVMVVDKKAFQKLSQPHQQVVRAVMEQAFKTINDQNRKDNEKALAALKDQGIQFLTPPAGAFTDWHVSAEKVADKLVDAGRLSENMVTKLHDHLEAFRSKPLASAIQQATNEK